GRIDLREPRVELRPGLDRVVFADDVRRDHRRRVALRCIGAAAFGGRSGMGLAAARAFANAGASVALADIRADVLDAATQELAAAGHRVIGLAGDISDEAYVKSLVEQT
ncbi:SDR family NAD(P)-dependent oxidoreductase, partial [Paraburkholderia sp. SIMBA_050]